MSLQTNKIIRVFPERTNATPTDELVRIGEGPSLFDFELPAPFDMIVDTKGVQTQQGALRYKMLKKRFADEGRATRIELPQTQDECAFLVRRLLDEKNRQ